MTDEEKKTQICIQINDHINDITDKTRTMLNATSRKYTAPSTYSRFMNF
jgi:hypothetical protein